MFQNSRIVFAYALTLSFWTGVVAEAAPLGTAFTYQGQLKEGGAPVSGPISFVFRLFDASTFGSQIGSDNLRNGVVVVNGFFTVDLDFGPVAFNGNARWLEVVVEGTLLPRHAIMPAPYALKVPGVDGHSLDAADGNPSDAVFVNNAGNVGIGTINPASKLHVIDGTGVSATIHPGAIAAFQRNGSAFLYVESSEVGVGGLAFGHPGKSQAGAVVFGEAATPEGLQFHTGGASRLAITSAGNVGIGDNSPTATLTVGSGDKFQVAGADGDVTFTDDQATITFPLSSGTNSPMIHMYALSTDNLDRMVLAHSPAFPNWGLQYQDNAGNEFHFLRNGTSVMTVDLENSAVGIGTNNPAAKLHVRGPAPPGGTALLLEDSAGNDIITVPDDPIGQTVFNTGARFYGGVRLSYLPPDGIYQVCLTTDFFLTTCGGSVATVPPSVGSVPGANRDWVAVSEQQQQIEALRAENVDLRARLEAIEAVLSNLPQSPGRR